MDVKASPNVSADVTTIVRVVDPAVTRTEA